MAAPAPGTGGGYPFFTNIPTPVVRSPESQQRVDELAGKVFTGYELQKLRTYIPNLRFTADEANLISHNMYGDGDQNRAPGGAQDASLQTKLRNFIGSVYVYDILTSLMRDISERVRRAVDEGVLDTDRGEIGKLVNALRGFVAVEHEDGLPDPGAAALNTRVFLQRISPTVLARIRNLAGNWNNVVTAGMANIQTEELAGVYRVGPSGLMSGAGYAFPEKIQAIVLQADNLPSFNTLVPPPPPLVGAAPPIFPSDDSIPSNLLRQLTQDTIDPTMLSMLHRKKMQALMLDNVVTNAGVTAGDRANTDWAPAGRAGFPNGFPVNPPRAGLHNNIWSQGGLVKGFPNVIQKFIRMDVLMFNRMRIMILNEIDRYWKNAGSLSNISNLSANDPTKNLLRLMDADYRVSGVPTPQCGPGSSAVFYNRDPSGLRGYLARVVPPYIVAADGTMVENPEAVFGPVCQRRQGIPDLVSTYPTGGPGQSSNLISSHLMGAKKTRRKSAPKKKTSRRK
eukprot:jgi/Mesvir1/15/Mv19993-RA.1